VSRLERWKWRSNGAASLNVTVKLPKELQERVRIAFGVSAGISGISARCRHRYVLACERFENGPPQS
jgi:hypothetical protein